MVYIFPGRQLINTISPVVTVDPQPEQFISCNTGDGIHLNDVHDTIIGPTTYIGVMADKDHLLWNVGLE